MKIIWEPKDIEAGIICCPVLVEDTPIGWFCKWTVKVCYDPKFDSKAHWRLSAIVADGMTTTVNGGTKEGIAQWLNHYELVPMKLEWLIQAMTWAKTTNGLQL